MGVDKHSSIQLLLLLLQGLSSADPGSRNKIRLPRKTMTHGETHLKVIAHMQP